MTKGKPFSADQKDLLEGGVSEVIVLENLQQRLSSGKKLRVKFGIDPTAPEMHIGHLVPLLKLAALQKLGHTIVFIIGDFTAMIGDPTGRSELRKPLTREQTRKNAEDYLKQAAKVLDVKKMEVHYNSEWLDALGIPGMLELASKVTVQRALERDDFQKRIAQDHEVTLLETMYPLLQGYDSVAIRADVEVGGNDQKFNLLMGRRIQRRYDQPEQDIITLSLIEGTDGVKKMSKTYGNSVGLDDSPNDIFGKIMSIPDNLILKYCEIFTELTVQEIHALKEVWEKNHKEFPARDLKMALARDVVKLCHDEKAAVEAEENFVRVFRNKEKPAEIDSVVVDGRERDICTLLAETGLATSKSDAKRLVEGGGVKMDEEKITDPFAKIPLGKTPKLFQVGKRKFLRISAR